MAKSVKLSGKEQVDHYLATADEKWKASIQVLRTIILCVSPDIAEHIKWNAPAFYYTGELQDSDPKTYARDIVVMNLKQKEHLLLIFPAGDRITDSTGLLEGNYADGRRMVKIADAEDAKAKAPALQSVIKSWLETL